MTIVWRLRGFSSTTSMLVPGVRERIVHEFDHRGSFLPERPHPAPATMISTKEAGATCTYLGVDITDRYSDSARPMDVCGLEISGDKLIPHFWTRCWGSRGSTDVTELLPEISAASADDWDELLIPEIERQQAEGARGVSRRCGHQPCNNASSRQAGDY